MNLTLHLTDNCNMDCAYCLPAKVKTSLASRLEAMTLIS